MCCRRDAENCLTYVVIITFSLSDRDILMDIEKCSAVLSMFSVGSINIIPINLNLCICSIWFQPSFSESNNKVSVRRCKKRLER